MPGLIDLFESASGIDVPDKIAGIDIPNVDMGNIGEAAETFIEAAQGMDDLVDKATQAREIVAQGTRAAGNCYGVIDQAYNVVDSIRGSIEPLQPLLKPDMSDPAATLACFTKENLKSCMDIVDDVLGLGKLLQKISAMLEGVQQIFNSIMEVCGDIIEKCMEFLGDIAAAFAEALNLEGALSGIQDLFSSISNTVSELTDIGATLGPISTAWEEANWMELATFGFNNFNDVKDTLPRFWPAWEASEAAYDSARGMGEGCNSQARSVWQKYRKMFKKLCDTFGVEVPDGFKGRDAEAMATVAPRGGIEPFDPDSDDDEELFQVP